MTSQVLDTKTNTFISPATETRSVLRQRQVVPLEHNWVWSKTTEGMVQLHALQIQKHLFIFTMLLNFVPVDISHLSFGFVLASKEHHSMARYGAWWHVTPVPRITCWESLKFFPSVFAYCKQSRTEGGGGLEMRLSEDYIYWLPICFNYFKDSDESSQTDSDDGNVKTSVEQRASKLINILKVAFIMHKIMVVLYWGLREREKERERWVLPHDLWQMYFLWTEHYLFCSLWKAAYV